MKARVAWVERKRNPGSSYQDACKTTPPHDARNLSGNYPVVWVDGQQEAGGDACGPFSAHGYLGHEPATVHAIAEWILQRKLPPADTVATR